MNAPDTMRVLLRARRRVVIVLVLVLVVALGSGIVALLGTRDDGLPKDAAFSYRGAIVTIASLKARMHTLGALYGVAEPSGAAAQSKYWRAAAQADAMSLILDRAAATQGVVVTDSQANTVLQQMISTQMAGGTSTSFDALLKKFGVTRAEVLLEVKRQQEIGLLFQKVTRSASATPSDAEVSAYFDKHASDFQTAQKRHLLNIVVATQSQALALATLAKGSDFATLAMRYSLDDSTRSKGGDLGTVAASALDTAYAHAAFAAGQGGIYGPIQTTYGWNVGKVVSIVPGRHVTLAEVRSSVVAELESNRALAIWRAWLTKQMHSAAVRYASAYRPTDPNQLPALSIPSTPAS